eukprot:7469727-Pyramimonas_sp.AAC.1
MCALQNLAMNGGAICAKLPTSQTCSDGSKRSPACRPKDGASAASARPLTPPLRESQYSCPSPITCES